MKTLRISNDCHLTLLSLKKPFETFDSFLRAHFGMPDVTGGVANPSRRFGRIAMTQAAVTSGVAGVVSRPAYRLIDSLIVGDEVVLPWGPGPTQSALNMGIWRAGRRTGFRLDLKPETAGIRVRRLA